MIVFADLHGCFNTFKTLLLKCRRQYPDDQVCVAGDLIDRGPRSREIIEFIREQKFDCILGNHEQMMLEFRGYWGQDWLQNGGMPTYNQYINPDGTGDELEIFEEHREWLRSLPYYMHYPDIVNSAGRSLIVSHAGITSPDLTRIVQNQDILWNREKPYDLVNKFNVFGHTPVAEPIIKDYYANIDTGCCFRRKNPPKLGVLTAFQFPDMKIIQQDNVDWEMHLEYK